MISIGWCDVAKALMIAAVIIMLDEGCHLAFEVSWQIIVFEQYPVFECLVPAFDLALGLRMTWCPADMLYISASQPFGQL